MIENTNRVGLSALIDAASSKNDFGRGQGRKKKTKITSGYIGYTIAPRINAAGRIKTASLAVELFLSTDPNVAYEIAEELCRTNKQRQSEENSIMREAYSQIEKYDINKDPVIVLDANNWAGTTALSVSFPRELLKNIPVLQFLFPLREMMWRLFLLMISERARVVVLKA